VGGWQGETVRACKSLFRVSLHRVTSARNADQVQKSNASLTRACSNERVSLVPPCGDMKSTASAAVNAQAATSTAKKDRGVPSAGAFGDTSKSLSVVTLGVTPSRCNPASSSTQLRQRRRRRHCGTRRFRERSRAALLAKERLGCRG
jgi:hypothetical protein